MLGNMGTSEASKASCFLEIIFSSRTCRQNNKVVRKTFTRNMTGSANSPLPGAFVCVCHHPPGTVPAILPTFWPVLQPHRADRRSAADTQQTHTRRPFPDIAAAQPEGCPVLLALSKKPGFSVTESKKEEHRQRRGLYKISGSVRCRTQPLL